jgi:hypothetical protein
MTGRHRSQLSRRGDYMTFPYSCIVPCARHVGYENASRAFVSLPRIRYSRLMYIQCTIAAQYILQEKRTTTTPNNSHGLDVPVLGSTSSLPSNIAPICSHTILIVKFIRPAEHINVLNVGPRLEDHTSIFFKKINPRVVYIGTRGACSNDMSWPSKARHPVLNLGTFL